jgi:NAD(P)H-quinone oxidoreductase subunit 5
MVASGALAYRVQSGGFDAWRGPVISNWLWLIGLGPAALGLTGLLPGAETPRSTARRILAAKAAAALTALIAIGIAAAVIAHGSLRTPLLGIAGVGFSLYLDALAAMMFCLVALIGLIVVSYSQHYMDGDPHHLRFMRELCLTLTAVLLVIVSGNLLQFALAWIATSWGLNRLLVFYPDRQAAILAARKKFLVSRVGDLSLFAAMFLVYRLCGSLQYDAIFAAMSPMNAASAPVALHAAALLLVCTALLKSAQFPLHGWLIEVMETPTPVSALLHAGIINAGGFLVLRFSDLIALSVPTLYTLSILGGLTALFGSVVMLTQTSVKVSLAYSTTAQMGFMMLECGLGAFSAALLHILAHSLYKAHAFLSSGSVIDIARASWTPSPGGKPHPARLVISIVAVLAVTVAIGSLFGATLVAKPGVFTMGAVVVLAIILLIANGIDEHPNVYVVVRTVGLAAIVTLVYFSLQFVMEILVADSVPPTQRLRGPLDLAIVVAIILGFGVVTLFQGLLFGRSSGAKWAALYAHLSNGLYVNTIANRWLLRVWPSPPQQAGSGTGR